jgi:YidC/Oxa1 family membrane protein insertase
MLSFIYAIIPGGDFGVAIIVFTILVRIAMYPLVKRQLHQTRMMRKLQPELKKIKKAANGNRQVEAMQMMELYKRYGVSPFRSIGILLIQLPIFIGLFYSIRIFTSQRDQIETYTYGFMQAFEPIRELIENPDGFNETLFGVIDLTQPAVGPNGVDIALLMLVILSAITQYYMSKQTMPTTDTPKKFRDIMKEAAEGKQADQAEMNALIMQNMIKIMPILLFFIMINLPGALALYYTVSNLVAVAQQAYLLRQDEEELEELADEPVIASTKKKSTTTSEAKKREKKAKEANITRIVAGGSKRRKK